MGQKIVHELGLDHSNKLLNRWMAHRVAELMELAENAPHMEERKAAQHECTELILRLWERRMDWPEGGPLKSVLPAFRQLMPAPKPSFRFGWEEPETSSDSFWSELLPQIKKLQEREMQVCLFAAIADVPREASESAQLWLAEQKEDLSDEERATFEILADWGGAVYEEEFELDGEKIPCFGSLPPEERTQHIHRALKRIEAERAQLLAKATSRDEPLDSLEPSPMQGNISMNEELHGEYFDQLYDKLVTTFDDPSEDDLEADDADD